MWASKRASLPQFDESFGSSSARRETEENDPIQPIDTGRSGPKAEFICYDTNDELVCEVGCKNMITTVSQDDCLSYFVVVHGIDLRPTNDWPFTSNVAVAACE